MRKFGKAIADPSPAAQRHEVIQVNAADAEVEMRIAWRSFAVGIFIFGFSACGLA